MFSEFYPFNHFFPAAKLLTLAPGETPPKNSVLLIWGGEDIHPSLYNRENFGSSVGKFPSHRDLCEWEHIKLATQTKIPIIGICRGAQLACAFAGGLIAQDVQGHAGQDHEIETYDNQRMETSSLHHQMMFPYPTEHLMIAWAVTKRSSYYKGLLLEETKRMTVEPEIVWFPKIRCLALQGHPEFMETETEYNQYVKQLCFKFLGD